MALPQMLAEKRQHMSAAVMRAYPNIANGWG